MNESSRTKALYRQMGSYADDTANSPAELVCKTWLVRQTRPLFFQRADNLIGAFIEKCRI